MSLTVESATTASTSGSSGPNLCHTCNELITTSQFIRVGSYKFHRDHFVCCTCKDSLHGKKFHHKDGKFYCSNDYVDKFCHTCRHCKQKIATGSVIQAFGGYYHPDHFVCATCSQPFKNGKYYESNSQPYCEEHYFALTAEKCEQCGKPVKDSEMIRVQGKVYHNHCLSCFHCGQALAKKGSIFQKDGKVYCRNDYLNFFCKRCTACGDHILKHCISVNDEYYHPDCLQCDICNKKLDKYICISGHLRCSDHTESPCENFTCSVCNKKVEDEVVLSVGKKVHQHCYKCAFCGTQLQKSTCKLKDEKLCCNNCMMKKEGSNNNKLSVNSSNGNNPSTSKSPRRSSANSSAQSTHHESKLSVSESGEDIEYSEISSQNSDLKSPNNGAEISVNSISSTKKSSGNAGNGNSNNRKISKAGINSNANANSGKIEWKKGELIGKGSFGKVYMAMNSATGELIAVKQVRLNTSEEQEQAIAIQNEIALMENLRHPNIVSLLGTQRNGNKLNILMEYVPGKSLDSLLEKFGAFSEKVIRSYTKQLLEALAYCIAEGTPVNLANGTSVPIEKVRVNDVVLALGTNGLTKRRVTHVIPNGNKECVELLFEDGRNLICTGDHRIRTADGQWIRAQDLLLNKTEIAATIQYPTQSHVSPNNINNIPVYKVKCTSRKSIGSRKVYDLSVPSNSEEDLDSFTANGIIVHNCHANRVVHRDIKGKNILIDTKGNLKLADFGSAKRFTNVMSKDAPSLSYNYTPLWTAPEVLVGDYNSKVDVWSLGCVIIEMASAKPPWSEQNFENPFRALYHIGNSDSIPKIPDLLSELGRNFVLTTLRRDPDKRPSAEECLKHDWLQGLEDLNDDNDDENSDDDDDNQSNNNNNNNNKNSVHTNIKHSSNANNREDDSDDD